MAFSFSSSTFRPSFGEIHGYPAFREPDKETHDFPVVDWRKDPKESFSDWTIVIRYETKQRHEDNMDQETEVDETAEVSETYHVHRIMLASGPRFCGYFANMFQADSFSENESKTSEIKRTEIEAKAFPKMLDYVYGKEVENPVSAEEVMALCNLGGYFGCQKLREDAVNYCRQILNTENSYIIYELASFFHDEEVLAVVKELLAKSFSRENLGPDHPIAAKVENPMFWIDVVEQHGKSDASYHTNFDKNMIFITGTLMKRFLREKDETIKKKEEELIEKDEEIKYLREILSKEEE